MFDYLQKFNSLPKELRDKVSTPEVMRSILDMEAKYKVDLAALVMKVMVKSINVSDLINYFKEECSLSDEQAFNLNKELRDRVLILAGEHLGLKPITPVIPITPLTPPVTPITQPIVSTSTTPTPITPITPAPLVAIIPKPLAPLVLKDESIIAAIKAAGIVLPSSDLLERLEKMLSTYQKGIRNKIDTRSSLAKKVEFGGLSLSDTEIEKLFKALSGKIIEKPVSSILKNETDKLEADKLESKAKLDRIIMQAEAAVSSTTPDGAKVALGGYDFKKSIEAMNKPLEKDLNNPVEKIDLDKIAPRKEIKTKTKEIEAPHELELLPLEDKELLLSAPVKKSEDIPLDLPVESKIEKSEIKSEIIPDEPVKEQKFSEPKEDVEQLPVNLNFKRPEPLGSASKPRIQDIKPVPRVMSPIEELQFLDLVNFRRLGVNATEIIDKIFAKIKLLERDGYDKMVQGVAAWRKSEINRLYLKIGQEAVMGGISFKDAILNRQKANKPHLSIEEIEAISKLNSRLSF